MPAKHALLSASGAHRWLHCTPSARLEAQTPDSSSSVADQGTVAHALAEHKLLKFLGKKTTQAPVSDFIDQEMEDLTDDYVSYVVERLAEAKKVCAFG